MQTVEAIPVEDQIDAEVDLLMELNDEYFLYLQETLPNEEATEVVCSLTMAAEIQEASLRSEFAEAYIIDELIAGFVRLMPQDNKDWNYETVEFALNKLRAVQ